jgi:hypothetical protein
MCTNYRFVAERQTPSQYIGPSPEAMTSKLPLLLLLPFRRPLFRLKTSRNPAEGIHYERPEFLLKPWPRGDPGDLVLPFGDLFRTVRKLGSFPLLCIYMHIHSILGTMFDLISLFR